MIPKMLIAYDAAGTVVATLDSLVVKTDAGPALVDFGAIEAAGAPLRLRENSSEGVWNVPDAVGSSTWPEWINRSHDFRVETTGEGRQKRIAALVHKRSGMRRDRVEIERAIERRIGEAQGRTADIRDIVGGPSRPLLLDDNGRAKARQQTVTNLPVIRASRKATNGS